MHGLRLLFGVWIEVNESRICISLAFLFILFEVLASMIPGVAGHEWVFRT